MEQNPQLVEQAGRLNEETRGEYNTDGEPPFNGAPPSNGAPSPSEPPPPPPSNLGAIPVKTHSTTGPLKSQLAAKSLSSLRFLMFTIKVIC